MRKKEEAINGDLPTRPTDPNDDYDPIDDDDYDDDDYDDDDDRDYDGYTEPSTYPSGHGRGMGSTVERVEALEKVLKNNGLVSVVKGFRNDNGVDRNEIYGMLKEEGLLKSSKVDGGFAG